MKKERRGNRGRCGARPRKREEGSEKDRERRSERIAASECKSTASDQSTTRTTRNRKDSFFLLIFVKFPPPPATPPPARSALSPLPSVQRSHLFCLLAGYFSLGGVSLIEKRPPPRRRGGAPKNFVFSQTRLSVSIALDHEGRFVDIGGNKITRMMFIRTLSNALEEFKSRSGSESYISALYVISSD